MKIIPLALILLSSLHGFSQNGESSEFKLIDTAAIQTKCDCLQRKYELKREIIDNTKVDENRRLAIDSSLVEKRQYTFLSLKAINEKCYQLSQNPETKTCQEEAKLIELDEEFELILRVIEMNARPHDHY